MRIIIKFQSVFVQKNKISELCEPTLFGDDGFWEHSLINIKGKSVGILKK